MNIWSIKSKPLRAAVAWLVVAILAVLVLAAMPIALVCLAGLGIWGGLVSLWGARNELAPLWRAATGREA